MQDKFMKYMLVTNGEKNLVSLLSEIRNILTQLIEQRLKEVSEV